MPLTFKHSKNEGKSTVNWLGAIDESWDSGIETLKGDLESEIEFFFDEIEHSRS